MKKFIVFANTMKKIIVFRKHYEKNNSVFGKRPNISSALCSIFLSRVKKKLIEGPDKNVKLHNGIISFCRRPMRQ